MKVKDGLQNNDFFFEIIFMKTNKLMVHKQAKVYTHFKGVNSEKLKVKSTNFTTYRKCNTFFDLRAEVLHFYFITLKTL